VFSALKSLKNNIENTTDIAKLEKKIRNTKYGNKILYIYGYVVKEI